MARGSNVISSEDRYCSNSRFYEITFYLYVLFPLLLGYFTNVTGIYLQSLVFSLGFLFLIPALKYTKLNLLSQKFFYVLIASLFNGVLYSSIFIDISYLDNTVKIVSSLFIASYFMHYRLDYFGVFLCCFSLLLSTLVLVFPPFLTYFTYGDLSLMLMAMLSLYYFKSEEPSLVVTMIAFLGLLILQTRTNIYIGGSIFCIILLKNCFLTKKKLIPLGFFLSLGVIYFTGLGEMIYENDAFLIDVKDRGFSAPFRSILYSCFVENFSLQYFVIGNSPYLINCSLETWYSFFGTHTISYENSFIRLNQKIGIFSLPVLFVLFYSLLFHILRLHFGFLIVTSLIYVRFLTGDIFLFGILDHFILIIFMIGCGFSLRRI